MSDSRRPPQHPIPPDEAQRLVAVQPYERLTLADLAAERRAALDRLCELARVMLDVDRAYVSIILEKEQVLIGRANVEADRAARDLAFCSYTIVQRTLLVVPDAAGDVRFADHPFVMGPFGLRFYAGMPLQRDGQPIGTFCVCHGAPREFSARDTETLEMLTALALDQVSLLARLGEVEEQVSELLRGPARGVVE